MKKNENKSLIEKIALISLGAFSFSKDRAKDIAKELIKKGELARSKEPEFVKKLVDETKRVKSKIEMEIKKTVKDGFKKLSFPAHKKFSDQLMKIEKRLKALEKKQKK